MKKSGISQICSKCPNSLKMQKKLQNSAKIPCKIRSLMQLFIHYSSIIHSGPYLPHRRSTSYIEKISCSPCKNRVFLLQNSRLHFSAKVESFSCIFFFVIYYQIINRIVNCFHGGRYKSMNASSHSLYKTSCSPSSSKM